MTPRSVAILGLGLIGGSLGLALRRAALTRPAEPLTLIGWDRDPATSESALQRGAIDQVADDAAGAAATADLVIIAVPVLAVRDIFAAIAPVLRADTVVTDVASTKAIVCDWASEFIGPQFVGGHPMAGSERAGIVQARSDLFERAVYCLTPTQQTNSQALAITTDMVEQIGARPRQIDPITHDRVLAAISHLPFLLSTALIDVTSSDPEWSLLAEIAATGFRDVSRLASGDARMHRDICLTNADAIRPWLRAAARTLEAIADDLDDSVAMEQRFEQAKTVRDEMLNKRTARHRQLA